MGLKLLTYHPYNDIYHCTYRLISIIGTLEKLPIEFCKLQIIDFYLVFPNLAKDIKYPKQLGSTATTIRKDAAKFPEPYEIIPSKKRLFSGIGDYQIQALHLLKAKNILKEEVDNIISTGPEFNNIEIQELIAGSRFHKEIFFITLQTHLTT